MQPKGQLHDNGNFATLTFHRTYPHTTEHVWEAISTPAGLESWLMCSFAHIEGHVGGLMELISGPAAYHSKGKILAWEPPRLLEYEWNVAACPEMPRGERAIFRYELTPDGHSTHVLVTYSRITKETARGFLPGLHAFLDRLEAQLDQRSLPDWTSRFNTLAEHYPEWTGRAPHTAK
jgi:uncharacterized protein YndB with AHSA1/START domain